MQKYKFSVQDTGARGRNTSARGRNTSARSRIQVLGAGYRCSEQGYKDIYIRAKLV